MVISKVSTLGCSIAEWHNRAMDVEQSPQPIHKGSLQAKQRLEWRDLLWFAANSGVAYFELLRARKRLNHVTPKQIITQNEAIAKALGSKANGSIKLPERIGRLLPRIARIVPFRADCLVQAMAGQAWLSRAGHPSDIAIGVDKPVGKAYDFHAWLNYDGNTVLGGRSHEYTRLTKES